MTSLLGRSFVGGGTLLLIVCTVYLQGVQSGLLDYTNPNLFTCPDGPLPNFIPCNADCREQHNASQGVCDDQQNCICSGPGIPHNHTELGMTTCTYTISLGLSAPLPFCHCASDATPALQSLFQGGCDWDCQCFHGAASGSCDFQASVCLCDYPNDLAWQWVPPTRLVCTASSWVNITTCIVGAAATGEVPPGC